MSESALLSICIPAYNAHESIDYCLRSIAGQSFDDYEVIVVDDGSTVPLKLNQGDYTADNVLSKRASIVRQDNAGTYAARQRAIIEARGRYVFCVDADDAIMDSGSFRKIADSLVRFSYPDVLLINAAREDGTNCMDYSSFKTTAGPVPREESIHRFFSDSGWNSMCTMIFRRSLFRAAESRPRLLMAEDRLQKAEVFAEASSFALLDEPLYLYRDNDGSAMNSPFEPLSFQNRVYVGCQIREMIDRLGVSVEEWAASFNNSVVASLFELASDKRRGSEERKRIYEDFREAPGCEEALVYLESKILPGKDRLCLKVFQSRNWGYLDMLLKGRVAASKAKRSLSGKLRWLHG